LTDSSLRVGTSPTGMRPMAFLATASWSCGTESTSSDSRMPAATTRSSPWDSSATSAHTKASMCSSAPSA
jgi:hypothetical protein